MSSNPNTMNTGTNATSPNRGVTEGVNNAASKVNDLVSEGINAVRGQIATVRAEGIDGVRRDVTDYARKQPLKALLVAGGIGALAALILKRR